MKAARSALMTQKTDLKWWGLHFIAEENNSTITLTKTGSPSTAYLDISYNDGKTWIGYTIGSTLTLAKKGRHVCFRARPGYTNAMSSGSYACYKFSISGKVAAYGNINSLKTSVEEDAESIALTNYCYTYLFQNCTSLVSAPELPATTLAIFCYSYMFQSCTSLTTAPTLPATTLAESCYDNMFYNCSSLTTAPKLPATTLANYCYQSMFQGCTSLQTAPALPATTLVDVCYSGMFSGCSSLTTAPTLPATTLANYCYSQMFSGCTSLTTAPTLLATTLANQCYYDMFRNCSNLASIDVNFTAWNPSNATMNWVNGAGSQATGTKTFTCPAALPKTTGDSNIPTGWTIVEK